MQNKNEYNINDFMDIIRELRGENGCPWDKEQTHESLKTPLIEECYEAIEAIDNNDKVNLCEELGDVLLQVALHSVIAEEEKEFTIENVVDGIAKKMIRRHPHVFANDTVENSEEVLKKWEDIKKEEKKEESEIDSVIKVPRAFPSNIRAQKVQKKAGNEGYGYQSYEEALSELYQALNELDEIRLLGCQDKIEQKYGSLLFIIVNLSIFLGVNAENSLTNATDKFINKFVDVKTLANKRD